MDPPGGGDKLGQRKVLSDIIYISFDVLMGAELF